MGGRILHLLVQSPLCKKVIVVTRRNVAEFARPKVQQVVVNMDKLEDKEMELFFVASDSAVSRRMWQKRRTG